MEAVIRVGLDKLPNRSAAGRCQRLHVRGEAQQLGIALRSAREAGRVDRRPRGILGALDWVVVDQQQVVRRIAGPGRRPEPRQVFAQEGLVHAGHPAMRAPVLIPDKGQVSTFLAKGLVHQRLEVPSHHRGPYGHRHVVPELPECGEETLDVWPKMRVLPLRAGAHEEDAVHVEDDQEVPMCRGVGPLTRHCGLQHHCLLHGQG
mmetsp:Transcript_27299/g.81337  ORF Transcript_27299/g.81337 Transcript_27299/m.81337 type:complete len:204 (+) Transcript_27299:388-999(+)